jgi:hypothetical protein
MLFPDWVAITVLAVLLVWAVSGGYGKADQGMSGPPLRGLRLRQASEGKRCFTSRRRTEARNCHKFALLHRPDLIT